MPAAAAWAATELARLPVEAQAMVSNPSSRALVMATANGFVHWAVLGTMRAAGATLEEVIETVSDAIVAVARRRSPEPARG